MEPPIPDGEQERLARLRRYAILDSEPEEAFDRVTRLASRLLGMPIALVSLVDESRQWFKARVGLDATETPREVAFCAHAIIEPRVMVVEDATADPRFSNNPLVRGEPDIRFYAGAPLVTEAGQLGTLCVIDREPRTLTEAEQETLQDLAAVVVDALELRHSLREAAAAERELSDRNAQLEQFVYAAAHDLNQPLRQMSSFSELLAADLGPRLEGDEARMLDFIDRGAKRLGRLLDGMVLYTRAGAPDDPSPPLDADKAIAEVLEDLGSHIEAVGASITVGAELPTGSINHAQFRQVIQNLVSNALKFAGSSSPKIRISAQTQDGMSRFSVSDEGVGIPVEMQDRIFLLFRRLHPDDVPGDGIGLAVCRRIVQRNGGKMWVESDGSSGTTFHFTIPSARGDESVPG